jgi:type I restriction enzyme S subunit
MNDELLSLPDNWTWTTLGEAFSIVMGQSPPSSAYNENGIGLPFFQGKAEFGETYPSIKKWCDKPSKIAEKGDVLISVRAPVGPSNICPEKACIGRGLAAIRGLSGVQPLFILYLLRTYEAKIAQEGTGTTFNAITGPRLREISIPLPPLAEQNRIVDKIEELISRMDKATNELEVAKIQFNHYRQSILKSAFQGKLSHKWRVKNGITTLWEKKKIGDLTQPSKLRYKPNAEDQIPFIGLEHIESNTGKIIKIGKSSEIHSLKSVFHSGDLLYGKLRPYLNKVAIPNFDGVCSTDILVYSKRKEMDNRYLAYFMLTNDFVEFTQRNMSGVQHPRVNSNKISEFLIPLPTIEEQQIIANEIDSRFLLNERMINELYQFKLKIEKLRASILKTAFEGKLVKQNPSDGQASMLLEKIIHEKERNLS